MSHKCFPELNSIKRQPGGIFTVTKESVAVATEIFIGPYNMLLASNAFAIDSAHPDFPSLKVVSRTGTRRKGRTNSNLTIGELQVQYRGVDPALPAGEGGLPEPIYSLERSVAQDPIDTHNKFEGEIGGTASAPINSAKFDSETGIFIGFASDSAYRGITSYLLAGSVWTKSYLSYTQPSSAAQADVGFISVPDGNAPTPAGKNWISLGLSFSKQGGVYQIQKSWRLSGDAGWDATIYNP